jgi:hypothetical protein
VKNDENELVTRRDGRFKKPLLLIGGWCFPLDDLEFKPEVFEFEKNNRQVKVTIANPVEDLVIAGKDLTSVSKGQDVSLPLWAAEALIEGNIAAARDELKLNYKDFENILWKEQLETPLQKLPDDFYMQAKQLARSFLEKANKERRDLDSVRKLSQFDTLLQDIVCVRMSKIVKLALRGGDSLGAMSPLTDEETWLYQRLTRLLKTWEKGMLARTG